MPVSISNIEARLYQKELPVLQEYEEPWGFYSFSQTVGFDYDDVGLSGMSSAQITIDGFFTANAEGEASNSDSAKSDALFAKYRALREYLLKAINKAAPDNVGEIGTDNDKRCVRLPAKLKNNNDEYIYAIPVSFSTTEISPDILRYTVQFRELQKVPCKLTLDGHIINEASVVIVCRRPRINYRTLAFASGSEAYVTGIDNRRYTINGTFGGLGQEAEDVDDFVVGSNSFSNSSELSINNDAMSLISSIINKDDGVVGFGVSRIDGASNSNCAYVMVTNHNVTNVFQECSVSVEISGEECNPSQSNIGPGYW